MSLSSLRERAEYFLLQETASLNKRSKRGPEIAPPDVDTTTKDKSVSWKREDGGQDHQPARTSSWPHRGQSSDRWDEKVPALPQNMEPQEGARTTDRTQRTVV